MAKNKKGRATTTQAGPHIAASLVKPPYLWLGPCSAAGNKDFLATHSITHILSVGSTPSQTYEGITYNRVSLNDSPDSSISKVCDEAAQIVNQAMLSTKTRGRIFIHCSAGISRSPTVVVAYLMKTYNLSLKSALGQVVRARPQVCPNPGFLRQLKALELEWFGRSTLDVDELPRREQDRLALFAETESSVGS